MKVWMHRIVKMHTLTAILLIRWEIMAMPVSRNSYLNGDFADKVGKFDDVGM